MLRIDHMNKASFTGNKILPAKVTLHETWCRDGCLRKLNVTLWCLGGLKLSWHTTSRYLSHTISRQYKGLVFFKLATLKISIFLILTKIKKCQFLLFSFLKKAWPRGLGSCRCLNLKKVSVYRHPPENFIRKNRLSFLIHTLYSAQTRCLEKFYSWPI